ncbi:hypothetical protein ACFYNO_00055 [Kitasatospora sp. NPDC006697]|uniref:hypothetical protein n=1 Tax=Kitasatospora sp. NPDC006697 TaxID=3364020 RepID=UPI0036842B07
MPELIEAVRQAVAAGGAPPADVRLALAQSGDPELLGTAGRLLGRLGERPGALRPVRLLLVADCPSGPLAPLLRAVLVAAGAWPGAEPEPSTGRADPCFEAQLAGAAAELVVVLLDERWFLPHRFDLTDPDPLGAHLAGRLDRLAALAAAALDSGTATLVLHTVPLPRRLRDTVLGLHARGVLTRHWSRLNCGLLELAGADGRIQAVDLAGLLATAGGPARSGAAGYSDAALLLLAQEVRRIAQARLGLSRRALALGPDAAGWPAELARTVRRLADQGVRLLPADPAGCHRGAEPPLPAELFVRHPAGWTSRAGSLRRAAEALGLGPEAVVFLTGSGFERGHVAAELPEVAVVDGAADPARLVEALLGHGWFDQP